MASRLYILGAGFSRPAGFPLADGLLNEILDRSTDQLQSFASYIQSLHEWLMRKAPSSSLGIEQFFEYADLHQALLRTRHHLESVSRNAGHTAWSASEDIDAWLGQMEDDLLDILAEHDKKADLTAISRFAEILSPTDTVATFNYDILLERALELRGNAYTLGFDVAIPQPCVTILKLHGSMEWFRPRRSEMKENKIYRRLYAKQDLNYRDGESANDTTGQPEFDHELFRVVSHKKMHAMLEGRDTCPWYWSGLAGLGKRKDISRIPGLGLLWNQAQQILEGIDEIVIVGFSMSDHDAFARFAFGAPMRRRMSGGKPMPRVSIISPDQEAVSRCQAVFGDGAKHWDTKHEKFDWRTLER